MRDVFPGYYPPTEAERTKIWTEGIIVLDTNALLNLFRYSESTRDELLEFLKKEKDRVWLPHQVGLEFHRGRRAIPGQQLKAFGEVEKALASAKGSVTGAIDELQRHPALEAQDLKVLLEKHMGKITKGLRKAQRQHVKAVIDDEAHERTFDAITELYDGKVGQPYDDERLKQIHKEGADRFARKVPPGYEDRGKDAHLKYGDLILWLQMLDHGKTKKKPMLFITDDGKPDWWEKTGSKFHGPRAELVDEFFAASGERIHFYQPRRFLKFAKAQGEEISDATVEEAKTVSTVREFKLHHQLSARSRQQVADIIEEYARRTGVLDHFEKIAESINRQHAPEIENFYTSVDRALQVQYPSLSPFAREHLALHELHEDGIDGAFVRELERREDERRRGHIRHHGLSPDDETLGGESTVEHAGDDD